MKAETSLQSMPPFVNDEFVLNVLQSLGGRATLMDMRTYIKTNYSGWTDNALSYFTSQVASLLKSGYLEKTKIDFRHGERQPIYYIPDDVRAIIARSSRVKHLKSGSY